MSSKQAVSSAYVRVFMNGGSQAVSIPRRFRLSTKRAILRRRGDALIIKPIAEADSWDELWAALEPLDGSLKRWPTGPAEIRDPL